MTTNLVKGTVLLQRGEQSLPALKSTAAKIADLLALTPRIGPALIQGWMYHGNLMASMARIGPAQD